MVNIGRVPLERTQMPLAPATSMGHLHILRWAVDRGSTLFADLCLLAVQSRGLESLQRLRSVGCP